MVSLPENKKAINVDSLFIDLLLLAEVNLDWYA